MVRCAKRERPPSEFKPISPGCRIIQPTSPGNRVAEMQCLGAASAAIQSTGISSPGIGDDRNGRNRGYCSHGAGSRGYNVCACHCDCSQWNRPPGRQLQRLPPRRRDPPFASGDRIDHKKSCNSRSPWQKALELPNEEESIFFSCLCNDAQRVFIHSDCDASGCHPKGKSFYWIV